MNRQDAKTPRKEISEELDQLAHGVVDAAFQVHRRLGPGLLESVYETCLAYELKTRGLNIEKQMAIPVVYREVHLDAGLRIDLLIEKKLVVELKAVEKILPIHHAQLLTYLKLSELPLGLLINFNSVLIKDGIKRIIQRVF